MDSCPICGLQLSGINGNRPDPLYHDCPNCGKFSLSERAHKTVPDDKIEKAILSHAIRNTQKPNDYYPASQTFIREVTKNRKVPSPKEQADNIIYWFGTNLKAGGKLLVVSPDTHLAIAGCLDKDGFRFVLEYLFEQNLIQGESDNPLSIYPAKVGMTLTFDGWDYYEELRNGAFNSRNVFMAMPFNTDEVNKVFDCYRDAAAETGFNLVKLDDDPQAGLIDDRMRVEILKAHFLVVDITYANPGAYWEAGYAEGLGKKVIYSCMRNYFDKKPPFDKGYGSHFDTNHHQTIIWESDKLAEAGDNLKATIRATFPEIAVMED